MLKISGNVGIGTVSPGAKLEVAGQVKITGGTPGANKVLTSDANGLASWQTPASFSEADTLQTVTTRGNTTSLGLVVNGQTIDHQTNNFFYVNSYDGMQLRINSDGAGTSNFQINNSANSSVLTVTNAGKVGIGTTGPKNKLDVEGGAVIGARYSGTNTAPSNGLLVQGNVGIGTARPSSGLKLDVEGKVGATKYCDQNGNNCTTATLQCTTKSASLTNCSTYWCQATVSCDTGYTMTGGGCRPSHKDAYRNFGWSYPNGNGWSCGQSLDSGKGKVYVRCCK